MNEQSYISPIIQAMIASQQSVQNAAQLKQQGDIAKQQEAVRQQQLKQEQTRIENEHEYQSGMLSAHHDMTQAQVEANRVQQMASAAELARLGGDPNAARASLGMQPMQGIPTAQEQATATMGQSQAQEQGRANVTQPFQQQMQQNAFGHESNMAMLQHSNALDMQQHQEDFQKNMKGMEQDWESGEKKLDRGTQMKIAQMDIGSRQSIAMLPYNPPAGALGTMIVAGLNGAPLSPDHPADRAALTQMYQNGMRPETKDEINSLKKMQTMLPILNNMEQIVPKLATSWASAGLQGITQGIANKISKTDLQTKVDEMNTGLVQVGKELEGMTGGRVSNRLLGISEGGLIGPGMTQSDAIDKINNLRKMIINNEDNVLLGGQSNEAKNIIYHMNGIKPSWLLTAPSKNMKGNLIDNDASIQQGHPVYTVGAQAPAGGVK